MQIDELNLTYEQTEELNRCFASVPLKGMAVVDAAENMTKLKPHMDAIATFRGEFIKKHTGGGQVIDSSHENWSAYLADVIEAMKRTVTVKGLTKIKRSQLDISEGKSPGVIQGFISVLINHGLLE